MLVCVCVCVCVLGGEGEVVLDNDSLPLSIEITNFSSISCASLSSSRAGVLRAVITSFHVGLGLLLNHFCNTLSRHSLTSIEFALIISNSSWLRPSWIPIRFHLADLGRSVFSRSRTP